MRKKIVKIEDGGEYLIGALNMDQVEAIIAPADELKDRTGIARVHDIILLGLNNPILDEAEKKGETIADDDPRLWTSKKLGKEFDLVSLPIIKDAVLTFSNLKQEVTPGEAQADQ